MRGGVGAPFTLGDFHPSAVKQLMTLNSNDPITLSRIDGVLRVLYAGIVRIAYANRWDCFFNKDKDCEKDTTFLLQSYSVYFDYNIFLQELVVNTCFPFTSWVDPYMHFFNNYRLMSIFYVMVLPILLALLIVSNVISDIPNTEMTLPVSMFILHKVAVALKYASLHPCEYKKLQDARDHDTVSRYQGSLQMLTSWLGWWHYILFKISFVCTRSNLLCHIISYIRTRFTCNGTRNKSCCGSVGC